MFDHIHRPPYQGKRIRPGRPPRWLMAVLSLCLFLLILYPLTREGGEPGRAAEAPAATEPSMPDIVAPPTPLPEPTPTPTPEPDYSRPVPQGERVEMEWFADAVFIGDSRTDGLRLYSGIKGAEFLRYTGLSIFDVAGEKAVIRSGESKISIYQALEQEQYGKVYIALGVNELGRRDSADYAETFGEVIDRVRELQPNARIYVQSIIPVNPAQCLEHDIPEYVTNEGIADYNAALAAMTEEKRVPLINISEALVGEDGILPAEIAVDGVHFKRLGYEKWLDYLMTHTRVGLVGEEEKPPAGSEPPVASEAPVVSETPVVGTEPVINVPPAVSAEPVVNMPPAVSTEPVVNVPPAVSTQPVVSEPPVVDVPPVVSETPVVNVPPAASEEPVVDVQPMVSAEPVAGGALIVGTLIVGTEPVEKMEGSGA